MLAVDLLSNCRVLSVGVFETDYFPSALPGLAAHQYTVLPVIASYPCPVDGRGNFQRTRQPPPRVGGRDGEM